MLYSLIEITVCFFAVLGIYFTVSHMINTRVFKNSGIYAKITVYSIKNRHDTEYALRNLMCRVHRGAFCGIANTVVIKKSVAADEKIIEKLSAEFGNLEKEE